MKLNEIHIRDPYILAYEDMYYLFGAPGKNAWKGQDGILCYKSKDLIEWDKPIKCFEAPEGFWGTENFWAPEVHLYNGEFYMFLSLKAVGHMRATQIFKAQKPDGPYEIWSCPITPNYWMCLDGTLYIEKDGTPYMIFCHEWRDFANNDGEMCAVELSKDLKKPVGEPKVLFKASEPLWAKGKFSIKENPKCVTDGPFMYRTSDGKLLMLWSSHRTTNCYCVAVSYSDNGTLSGNWKHCEEVLVDLNGGHGMLFNDLDGKLNYTYHFPNSPSGSERAIIKSVKEIEKSPFLKLV